MFCNWKCKCKFLTQVVPACFSLFSSDWCLKNTTLWFPQAKCSLSFFISFDNSKSNTHTCLSGCPISNMTVMFEKPFTNKVIILAKADRITNQWLSLFWLPPHSCCVSFFWPTVSMETTRHPLGAPFKQADLIPTSVWGRLSKASLLVRVCFCPCPVN